MVGIGNSIKLTFQKYRHFIIIFTIVILAFTLFYFRYLFLYVGLPAWGNYIIPISANDLKPNIFFNFYQYNTAINISPETSALSYLLNAIPLKFFTRFTSIFIAEKLYVLFSAVFLGLAAYYLSGQVTKIFILRVVGLLFFLFNPFMVMILSAGDSLPIVSEGFILISVGLLINSFSNNKRFPSLGWVFSILFLSISLIIYAEFYLGMLLYIITLLFYYIKNVKNIKSLKFIIHLILCLTGSITMLFIFILPDLYPIYFLGGNSSNIGVPSLSGFFGTSPWDNLLLNGYTLNSSWLTGSPLGSVLSNLLIYTKAIILLFLLVSPVIAKKLKYLTISLLIIFFSFLGAGPSSILFPIMAYLYIHLPGFASINASYYWDWFIIVPLYFILILSVFSEIPLINLNQKRHLKFKLLYDTKILLRKFLFQIFTIIILFVLFVPIISQNYYSSSGINNTTGLTMPDSYLNLETELQKLTNNSSAGVAYFNPDIVLFYNNTNKNFLNPLIPFPAARTAELQYYGVPSSISTRYFYWVYQLFYQNQTRYLGSLMGLAGIKYFIILNDTNSFSYDEGLMPFSEGKNTTQIMNYQYGVKNILVGNNYSIYENLNYTGSAITVKNLTLVSGGFNELSVLPYYGFNISNQGIIMP